MSAPICNPNPGAAKATRAVFEWIINHRSGDALAINKIGKRAVAACHVLSAGFANGISRHKIIKKFKISPGGFDTDVVAFRELLGIESPPPPENKKLAGNKASELSQALVDANPNKNLQASADIYQNPVEAAS